MRALKKIRGRTRVEPEMLFLNAEGQFVAKMHTLCYALNYETHKLECREKQSA